MQDTTVLVTGATAGIGLETARGLAAMGARVIMVGRSPEKTRAQADDVRRTTNSDRVDTLIADLSLMAEVRRLAGEVRATYDRLDVLVNNVGAMMFSRKQTAEGHELTWALNHLGYMLLADELADLLVASAPARIINVSSDAHKGGAIRWDDPEYQRGRYSAFGAYGQSKLANIMHAKALARRMEGTGVTVNALHPGVVASNFAITNNRNPFAPIQRVFMKVFAISPEEGAQTSIYLASSPEVAQITGRYFARSRPVNPKAIADDVDAQERLWAMSAAQLGMAEPA